MQQPRRANCAHRTNAILRHNTKRSFGYGEGLRRANAREREQKNSRIFVHRNCTRLQSNYLISINSPSIHHGTNGFGARSLCRSYPARFVSQQTWGSRPDGHRSGLSWVKCWTGRRTCLASDVLSVSSTPFVRLFTSRKEWCSSAGADCSVRS